MAGDRKRVNTATKRCRVIVIGITGGFGTGKTTVAEIFKKLGVAVLDADRIAHKSLRKNTVSYKKVVKLFGNRVLNKSDEIDKKKLANFVFSNKKSLDELCHIIHPIVIDKIKNSIKRISDSGYCLAVAIDAPLLIEAGLHNISDYLIVVKTSKATQIKRAMKKTGLGTSEIAKRIQCQMPLSKKVQLADYVIDNEGNKRDAEKAVRKIWESIKQKSSLH